MEIRVTMNSDYSALPGTSEHHDRHRFLRNRILNPCNMIASESLNYFRILEFMRNCIATPLNISWA